MKKRIALGLATVIALGVLAGCGGAASSSGGNSGGTTSQSTSQQTTNREAYR